MKFILILIPLFLWCPFAAQAEETSPWTVRAGVRTLNILSLKQNVEVAYRLDPHLELLVHGSSPLPNLSYSSLQMGLRYYFNPEAKDLNYFAMARAGVYVFDGTSNTLMVGEHTGGEQGSHQGHQWVHFNVFSTVFGINGPATIPGEGYFQRLVENSFSSYHPGGCHFLRADGSVHFESENMDQVILSALTTRAGGEVISSNDL